jgi:hypothetical protein
MRLEHCSLGGHSHTFTTSNYKITTNPRNEWLYVVGKSPCPDMGHDRRIVPIDELCKTQLAEHAKLTRPEVIAIVLYTGPMFVVYNGILRRFPKELFKVFKQSDNLFSTTIFVLVSAVQKLSRSVSIPAGMMLYRGVGMELPDSFTNADKNGCKGYCEFGFMSTTADRNVAVQYSGVRDKKPQASIMEIRPNSVDRGADISQFSQYPGEREFLFVPMSFLQGGERCRKEVGPQGGVLKVIDVSVNINLKTETVEELIKKKKNMHLSAFKSVIDETKRWMQEYADEDLRARMRSETDKHYKEGECDIKQLISSTIKEMQETRKAHEKLDTKCYVDDLKYKALVTRMLSSQECAKQKLWLWLENEEMNIFSIIRLDFKSAHGKWLSFLKQRYAVAAPGTRQLEAVAVQILQCKGLMVTNDASTEDADGEPLIYAAAGDGWALEDVKVWPARAARMQRCWV